MSEDEAGAGTGAGAGADALSELVAQMCRHARHLRVMRFSSLESELADGGSARSRAALQEAIEEVDGSCYNGDVDADGAPTREAKVAEQSPVSWYLMLRAADRFAEAHGGRMPGEALGAALGSAEEATALATDAAALWAIAQALCAELGLGAPPPARLLSAKHAAETARFGASEPHTVAAFLGGVAAQEAVKLLTHMFVPFDNCLIYNGALGLHTVLRL